LAEYLRYGGGDVLVVREPGATRIGESVRELVLNRQHEEMRVHTEMLLFMASRAQLVREMVLNALNEGFTVLADRFLASTYAYQGIVPEVAEEYQFEGVPFEEIDSVAKVALGKDFPTFTTIIFSVNLSTSMKRMHGAEIARHGNRVLHGASGNQLFLFGDRLEHMAAKYQAKVAAMYGYLVRTQPEKYIAVDAAGSPDAVFGRLLKVLNRHYFVKDSDQQSVDGCRGRDHIF